MKTKKLLALLLGATLCTAPLLQLSASAVDADDFATDSDSSDEETFTSGNYTYTLLVGKDDNTQKAACIESSTDTSRDLVIPDKLDGYDVVALGDRAFLDNQTAVTITIPATLIGTGLYSFCNCSNVTEYKVAEGNTYYQVKDGILYAEDFTYLVQYPIGKNPTSFEVPDGVYDIGNSAFCGTKSLASVTIPESVTQIGVWAFANCPVLNNVKIPSKVTEIEDFCFSHCKALVDITVPDTITTIGAGAFSDCALIKEFTIPKACTGIGQAAFAGTGMTEITIPATVTEIGYSAFGYELDANSNLAPKKGFIIRGDAGSAAARYSADDDNDGAFEFKQIIVKNTVAAMQITTAKSATAEAVEKTLNVSRIVLIIVICVALVVLVILIVILVMGKRRAKAQKDEPQEQDEQKEETTDEES